LSINTVAFNVTLLTSAKLTKQLIFKVK